MKNLEYALNYASRGWKVFPAYTCRGIGLCECGRPDCKSIGKHPKTTHGVKDATSDSEQICDWWTEFPNANIGVATGAASNLTILDLEYEGIQYAKKAGFNSSLICKSGKGYHLYCKYAPEAVSRAALLAIRGLDVRSDGGYVIAPESIHSSGRIYQWYRGYEDACLQLPDFPMQLLEKEAKERDQQRIQLGDGWVSNLLKGVSTGGRQAALVRLAGYFLNTNPPDVVKAIIRSWNENNEPPLDDSELEFQLGDVCKRWANNNVAADVQQPGAPARIIRPSEYRAEYKRRKAEEANQVGYDLSLGHPKLDSLLRGLHRTDILTIAAHTGQGKTAFTLQSALHIASSGKKVLFFPTEMSADDIYGRIELMHGVNFEIPETFIIADDLFPSAEALINTAHAEKPDVIILDHVQQARGDASNAKSNVSALARGLKQAATETNSAAILVSQFRRPFVDKETKIMPVPSMFELKESGTLETISAQVLLLHRVSEDAKSQQSVLLGMLDKNRHGQRGTTTFTFNGPTLRFEEMTNVEMPPTDEAL